MITREQYMTMPYSSDNAVMAARHRAYYAQFVDARTIDFVVCQIGADRLRASTDPHFNDIPLRKWDNCVSGLPGSGKFRQAGDYYTVAGGVCLAKEAARQYVGSENR